MEQEPRFISTRKVCEIAGFSRATIARKIKEGSFPKPVISTGNCARYDLGEVLAWRAAMFEQRAARSAGNAAERIAA